MTQLPLVWLFMAMQVAFLAVGALWMALADYPFANPDPLRDTLAFIVLLGVKQLLELLLNLFPQSLKISTALHARVGAIMRAQGTTHHQALLLAGASSLGEEVFFRGVVQNLFPVFWGGWLGVVGQAIVFAALHPAPRQAWVYTGFIFLMGLVFGAAYLLTGSLIPGILLHFINNALGFYQMLDEPR
jgi:uncharacterized protein